MKYQVEGAGPPIVFLHGIPTHRSLWYFVVRELAPHFRCITIDFPGLGSSPPLPENSLDPERFARELDGVRRALNIPTWHVVGHDAGSTVAVHYSTLFPQRVRRLALLSPPLFPEFQPPWFFRLLRVRGLGELLAPLVMTVLWSWSLERSIGRRDTKLREILQDFRGQFRGRDGIRRFLWLIRWGKPSEVLGRAAQVLPRIEAPTWILHGLGDTIIPRDFALRAEALIPDSHLEWIEAGHFIPLAAPEEVAALLTPFLRAAERSGSSAAGTIEGR